MSKIFIVRHAKYENSDSEDPRLSNDGKLQSNFLAQKIKRYLEDEKPVIWTSSASRAKETADILKSSLSVDQFQVYEKLWADNWHQHDFDWLKNLLDEYLAENVAPLIIVTHLEYVQEFPAKKLGFHFNSSSYAEGVFINDKTIIKI